MLPQNANKRQLKAEGNFNRFLSDAVNMGIKFITGSIIFDSIEIAKTLLRVYILNHEDTTRTLSKNEYLHY